MITEVRATQMRMIAALMAHDFPLVAVKETDRAGKFEFVVLVGEDRQADAQRIVELYKFLEHGDNSNIDDSLQVPLGKYERSLQRLHKLIWTFKEEAKNGSGEQQFRRK